MNQCKRLPDRQQGSVLLEALVAIVIFSVGILSMIWLQAAATRQVTDAKYRLEASFAANQVLGEMWVSRSEPEKFKGESTVTTLPGGKRTVAIEGGQVTVTVSWQIPGEPKAHSYEVVAQING